MTALNITELEKFTKRIYHLFPVEYRKHDLYLEIYNVLRDVSEQSYKECKKEVEIMIMEIFAKYER